MTVSRNQIKIRNKSYKSHNNGNNRPENNHRWYPLNNLWTAAHQEAMVFLFSGMIVGVPGVTHIAGVVLTAHPHISLVKALLGGTL